jgi:hypothetical protein
MFVQRHHLPRELSEEHSPYPLPCRQGWAKKNSSDSQKSFEYGGIIFSSLDLTYLSRYSIGMELAPYFPLVDHELQQVVKASSGHFPQPFLIRDVIRTGAKI